MKTSRRQFLVRVSGLRGYYVTKTGGDISVPVTKAYDGGERNPDLVPGIRDVANVVCGRHFDALRDGPILATLRRQVGTYKATISVQPTDADFVPVGAPTVYADALLTRIGEPAPDAGAGDPSTYELEFAVSHIS